MTEQPTETTEQAQAFSVQQLLAHSQAVVGQALKEARAVGGFPERVRAQAYAALDAFISQLGIGYGVYLPDSQNSVLMGLFLYCAMLGAQSKQLSQTVEVEEK